MPFWLAHAVDQAGGLNTCLRDDGSLISPDKWLWSQWRAVWVFSRLYLDIEPDRKWLDLARHVYDFARRFGWDDDNAGWRLLLDEQGNVKLGCESIYVDAFAIYGLTSLAQAMDQDEPIDLARRTADSVLRRLRAPHDQIPHFPYPIPPGARVHGLPMMFSLVLWELGRLINEPRYIDASAEMSDEVFNRFYRPDRDLVLERIAADGAEYPPPLGTAVVPGHVIEGMWFQIHIARDRGDRRRIEEACRLIRRHIELGWDNEFGGILHAIDADGRKDVAWPFPDAKIWWPHTEALYALLLAHEYTGQPWAMEWFEKVYDYSFSRYPLPECGEWRQKLDRLGRPITDVVALPVKDPFHLPRALILSILALQRLCRGQRRSLE